MAQKKKLTVPIKLEHWFTDLQYVDGLRNLLEEPALQQAIAILKEAAGPSATTISANPQENSHKLSWYAGYRDAFNDLEKLTRRPNSGMPQPDEWNHIPNQ